MSEPLITGALEHHKRFVKNPIFESDFNEYSQNFFNLLIDVCKDV